MRLHAHGIRPPHQLYTACMLTAPPILCLYAPACSRYSPTSTPICRLHAHGTAYPLFICACMLTVFTHLNTSMPSACSWNRLSFVPSFVCPTQFYMCLHAHGPCPPPLLYPACILTATLVPCHFHTVSTFIALAPTIQPYHNTLQPYH